MRLKGSLSLENSRLFFVIGILVLLSIQATQCIGLRSPAGKKGKKIGSVFDRNLVKEAVTYQSIIKEYKRYNPETAKYKRFAAPTLAYVTPWNNHGYDVAKIFNTKLTYVAPVWYQVKGGRSQLFLTGGHDVDQGWIAQVRANHNSTAPPLIVPRFILEGWGLEDYQHVLADQQRINDVINLLVQECVKQRFDGLVLEHGYPVNNDIAPMLIGLANQLHELNKKLILVISAEKGPQAGQSSITSQIFLHLAEYVDHFSLMTYDFSSPQRPGPNAPLSWMTQSVLRLLPPDHKSSAYNLGHKILMGMNFYGYEYWPPAQGEAVLGGSYVKTLTAYKPRLVWDANHHEHSFVYKDVARGEKTVYYPTLKSIADRLQLAEDLGVGVSIWEIGQGLDYFYDLF